MFGEGSWTALPNNSKGLFEPHIEVFVRWSLAYEGSIVSQDGKLHLNYVCICIHRLTCIIDVLDS